MPAGGQAFAAGPGTWTVSGGGTGLSGPADQLHLVSQSITASGGVAARLTAVSTGRAGVMVRTSTAPGSPYYAAMVGPAGDLEVVDRSTTGGATTTVEDLAGALPSYLWVTQSGGVVTTYTSPDGDGELRADLTVACDGRGSIVRQSAGLTGRDYPVPFDVWWFRLPREAGAETGLGLHDDLDAGRRGDARACHRVLQPGI